MLTELASWIEKTTEARDVIPATNRVLKCVGLCA